MVVTTTSTFKEEKAYPNTFNLVSSRRNSQADAERPSDNGDKPSIALSGCSRFDTAVNDARVLATRRKFRNKTDDNIAIMNEGIFDSRPLLHNVNNSDTDFKDKLDIAKALEMPLAYSNQSLTPGQISAMSPFARRRSGLRTGNHSPSSRTQGDTPINLWSPSQTRAQTSTHVLVPKEPVVKPYGAGQPCCTKYQNEQSIHTFQNRNHIWSSKHPDNENARQSYLNSLESLTTPVLHKLPQVREGDKNHSFVLSTPVEQTWKESTSSDIITRYKEDRTTLSLEVQLPLETPNLEDVKSIPSIPTEKSYSKKWGSLLWRYKRFERLCRFWGKPPITILTNTPKDNFGEEAWLNSYRTTNGNTTTKQMSEFKGIHDKQSSNSFWSAWNIFYNPSIWVSPFLIVSFVYISANQISVLDNTPDCASSNYCIYLLALSSVLTIYRLFLAHKAWASALRSCRKWLEMIRECCELLTKNVHCGNHVQAMVAILVSYTHLCRKQLRMDTTISEVQIFEQITRDYDHLEPVMGLKQNLEDNMSSPGFLGQRLMMIQEKIIERLSKRSLITKAEKVSLSLQKAQRCFGDSLTIRDVITSQDAHVATLVRFSCVVACAVIVMYALANTEKILVTATMFVVIFILLLLDRLAVWVANPFELSGLKSSSLPLEHYCEVIGYEAENLIRNFLLMLKRQTHCEKVLDTSF